jgi:hypothetical protein
MIGYERPMTPDYFRNLAAIWQRLAAMEPEYSLEKQRLQARATDCLRQASDAEAEVRRKSVPKKQ